MFYKSTRDSSLKISSAEAITKGISDEGGLFVPENIPTISKDEIDSLRGQPYHKRAFAILKKFLTDFTDDELEYCTKIVYNNQNFDTENIIEITNISKNGKVLELWHGKTCAFKDMALQILPYLLVTSAKKLGIDKEIIILVATSGDTGKAALEGFKDVPGTKIMVFYPENGVSPMQKKQMITQEGNNVSVCAIKGNFDDCQNGVKSIFTDDRVKNLLSDHNLQFSSANSINWGRLAPQIVYYISAYVDLLEKGEISDGEEVNIVVPTGNFGNILAAYYAKKMGMPFKKLVCASNSNNILTDFINTGKYNKNRDFHTTISPSMDILISSNLERLLYLISNQNDMQINSIFKNLSETGEYIVDSDVHKKLLEDFYGGYADDDVTKSTIGKIYKEENYIVDTHTAVAITVCREFQEKTGDNAPIIIASTASPYKFCNAVLESVSPGDITDDEFIQIENLHKKTGLKIPESLANLKTKTHIYTDSININEMEDYVLKYFISK